jgi:pseudouridine synthase
LKPGLSSEQSSGENRPRKTLERVISKAGAGSRTQARSWIHAGQVQVNGKVVQNPDQWIDFVRDKILLNGKPLTKQKHRYILLYKPTGYITTFKDPEGRPTVYGLIEDIDQFVSPAGRLDLDTSGLLILTNDTQFADRLTSPDHKVPKPYLVKCSTILTEEALDQLRRGVELSDGPTKPAVVRRLRDSDKYTHLEITITEGRNRQVRRMIEAVESKVLKLVRTHIGSVTIGDLKIGNWRELTSEELASLSGSPTRTRTSAPAPDSRIPRTKKSRRPSAARR